MDRRIGIEMIRAGFLEVFLGNVVIILASRRDNTVAKTPNKLRLENNEMWKLLHVVYSKMTWISVKAV
jgi:hypothetical protein